MSEVWGLCMGMSVGMGMGVGMSMSVGMVGMGLGRVLGSEPARTGKILIGCMRQIIWGRGGGL